MLVEIRGCNEALRLVGSDFMLFRPIAVVALLACSMSGCAHPQPAQSWPELVQRLAPANPVAVTDLHGAEVRGRLSAVSASSLTLNVKGVLRQFDSKDLAQVRRDGDPLWNGLAIGAGIGVAGALINDSPCSGQRSPCNDVPQRVAFFAVMTAAGITIDALHRDRTVLYRPSNRVTLRIVPLVTADRKSLSFTVGFVH